MDSVIKEVNKKYLKKRLPDVVTGDIVKVYQKIKEGEKTRTQVFEGIVIERSGGSSINASITVRKISNGIGVEKKIPLHSPLIENIKVLRSSKVRRKKIFYLRKLTGKAARIKEKQREILEEIGGDVSGEEREGILEEKEGEAKKSEDEVGDIDVEKAKSKDDEENIKENKVKEEDNKDEDVKVNIEEASQKEK